MACPYCQGDATQEVERATALGYRLFRCRPCRRTFTERTGTPFNHLQVPTDIALLVVLWRLRYKLSLRDLADMFLTRGFTFVNSSDEVSMDYSDGATQHLDGVPAILRVQAAISPLCGGPETRCLHR